MGDKLKQLLPRVRWKGLYTTRSDPPSSQDEAAPRDRFHLVYICFLMAGVGFLIPWTSYISAIDYFFYYYVQEFPAVSIIIPMGYLVTTFLASSLNLLLVKVVAIHNRITFGYVMFVVSLLTVPLLDVGIHSCAVPTSVSFYITLLSIAIVGLGSGVQQSSYYGLSSMLPRQYTQAVMAGESVAGVIEITFRIITKASVKSARTGAIIFFVLSLVFILLCLLCHCYIRTNKMVRYYTGKCQPPLAGEREEEEVRVTSEGEATSEELEMENLDVQLLLSRSHELSEFQESEGEGEDAKDGVVNENGVLASEEKPREGGGRRRRTASLKNTCKRVPLKAFVRVLKQIWPLIGAIFIAYFVTLLLFPGLLSEVQNCHLGSWAPILIIAIFSTTDFVAKWFALLPLRWSPRQLLVASSSRIILIPLVLLCVAPSPTHPVLGGYAIVWAGLFTLILGLSNGYFGSLPLIVVSAHVKDKKDRELAGTVMTWVLLCGLLLGSVCAYALSPLTTLTDHTLCLNSTTELFTLCNHDNNTVT